MTEIRSNIAKFVKYDNSGTSLTSTNVQDSINELEILATGVGVALDNYVIIKTLSDLPTPVGSVITLETGKYYHINGIINIGTNTIDIPDNCRLQGLATFQSGFIYTGTGSMMTSTDSNISLSNLSFFSPSVGSQLFNFTNNLKTKNCLLLNCFISGVNSCGTISGYDNVLLDTINNTGISNGYTCNNNNHLYFISMAFDESCDGTYLSMASGTYESVLIRNSMFHTSATATGLNIDSSTITVLDSISVIGNDFLGSGTLSTGFDSSYNYFLVRSNTGVKDFRSYASMYMSANLTQTINVPGSTWTKIAGATTSSNLSRFSMPVDNRLAYIGKDQVEVIINVSLSAYYTSGSARVAEIGISKNGNNPEPSTINSLTVYGADEPSSTSTVMDLSTGDYVEIWFQKFGGAASDDYVFSYLNVQINEI